MDTIIALQGLASPTLDRLMLLATSLGSHEVFAGLLVVFYLAFDAAFGRRLGITFLAGMYLNDLLKSVIAEPRPFEVDPAVLRLPEAVGSAPGSSFPSGHAQASATFWGLVALRYKRAWVWLAAVVLVAVVSVSRLYLGVHFPADVVAGIGLAAVVILVAAVVRRLRFGPGRVLTVVAGLALPLALHLGLTTTGSHTLLGALSAFIVGPELVRHRADGGWVTRVAMALVGLALVAGVTVLTALVPALRSSAGPLGAYFRYLAIGLAGTVLAPLACRALRLSAAPAGAGPVGPRPSARPERG